MIIYNLLKPFNHKQAIEKDNGLSVMTKNTAIKRTANNKNIQSNITWDNNRINLKIKK